MRKQTQVAQVVRGSSIQSVPAQPVCWLLAGVLLVGLSCRFAETLPPTAGFMQHMAPLVLPVPGGSVSLATGNLSIARTDFSLETRLGPLAVGAVYNSADNAWRWSFDLTHDGHHFTDASGAWHDVSRVGISKTIPGTHWVVVDDHTMRTKSGLTYVFEDGWLASIHWWRNPGRRIDLRREVIVGQSRVTAIEYCFGGAYCADPLFTLEYDSAGRLERIVDRAGREAEFSYDAEGRLIAARDALDLEKGWPGTSYGYTTLASGQSVLSSRTNSEGERIEYAYEGPRSQLSRVVRIGEGNPETRFEYGSAVPGEYETVVTHPDSSSARYRYDALWRLLSFENEANETQTFTWNDMRLVSRTDAAGLVTTWRYRIEDQVREEVSETQPSGNVVVSTYDRFAVHAGAAVSWPLLSRVDSLGTLETRIYSEDAYPSTVEIENGAGETAWYAWFDNPFSPASFYTSWNAEFVEMWGNQYGLPALTLVNSIQSQHWRYDEVGNLLKGGGNATPTSAGRPGIASRIFNADRELSSLELSKTESTWSFTDWTPDTTALLTIERRSDGQPTRITRPYGGDTEFDYDTLGRRIARREWVDGGWQAMRWEYDGRDRVTAVEKPNGMRTQTKYDGVGRVTEIKHLRDGVMDKLVWLTWSNGRLAVRYDSALGANESFAYNAAGQVSSILYPGGERLEFDYDLRGRVTEKRYRLADGSLLRTLGFAYDDAGRLHRLAEDGATLLEWTYSNGAEDGTVGWPLGTGALRSIIYGNGLVRSFEMSRPRGGEMWRKSRTSANGTLIEDAEIIRKNDYLAEEWGWLFGSQAGEPLDKVTVSETMLPNGDTFGSSQLYRFSPGTRIEADGERWEERVAAPRVNEQYDELGNQFVFSGYGIPCTYNGQHNRLLECAGQSYVYDAAGFVVERSGTPFSWDAMGRIASMGEDTFVWDSLGRPLSRALAGQETRYLFGGEVEADAEGRPRALDLGDVRLDLETGGHLYRHRDFRGNVQFVTDDAGAVAEVYGYTAYGVTTSYGESVAARSFAGGEMLGDQVVQLGVRLYDPAVGRFLSPDPVYQVVNQYAYAEGNPIDYWDPNGAESMAVQRFGHYLVLGGGVLIGVGLTAPVSIPAVVVGLGVAAAGIEINLLDQNGELEATVEAGVAAVVGALEASGQAALLNAQMQHEMTLEMLEMMANAKNEVLRGRGPGGRPWPNHTGRRSPGRGGSSGPVGAPAGVGGMGFSGGLGFCCGFAW